MDFTEDILNEALREKPVGETDNFLWFITIIGILALKKDKKIENCFPEKEDIEISLDKVRTKKIL
tara:strand:+ start:1721 stop:1915 length:195 start_codon:yes stop_codon:yes gene_type:complete